MNTFQKRLFPIIVVFTILLTLLTLLGFSGSYYFIFDILSCFRFQYAISCIVLLLLYIAIYYKSDKSIPLIITLCITLIINLTFIFPYLGFNLTKEKSSESDLKIYFYNVLRANNNYKSVVNSIKKEDPDLIILQEVTDKWITNLVSLKKSYSNHLEIPRQDYEGIAIYSKLPLENIKENEWFDRSVICLNTVYKNTRIKIVTIHTSPPFNKIKFARRNKQLVKISRWAKSDKLPAIVIGDLNITMFSPSYIKMEKNSGLINCRKGLGYYPSWPNFLIWILRVPIDHILYSNHFKTTKMKILKDLGSDHLPVVVSLKFR